MGQFRSALLQYRILRSRRVGPNKVSQDLCAGALVDGNPEVISRNYIPSTGYHAANHIFLKNDLHLNTDTVADSNGACSIRAYVVPGNRIVGRFIVRYHQSSNVTGDDIAGRWGCTAYGVVTGPNDTNDASRTES